MILAIEFNLTCLSSPWKKNKSLPIGSMGLVCLHVDNMPGNKFKFVQKAFRFLCFFYVRSHHFTIFCHIFPSQTQPNSKCFFCPIFTCGTLSFFPSLAFQICQSRKHQQSRRSFQRPLSARPLHAQVPEHFVN